MLWIWLLNNNHDSSSSLPQARAHSSTPHPRFKPFKRLHWAGISLRSFHLSRNCLALDRVVARPDLGTGQGLVAERLGALEAPCSCGPNQGAALHLHLGPGC